MFAVLGYAFGYGVFEFVDALAGDGGDGEEGEFAAAGEVFECPELVGVGGVELGGDEEGGFGGEVGVEGAEFVEDDAVVFYGVCGFDGLGFAIAREYRGLSAPGCALRSR